MKELTIIQDATILLNLLVPLFGIKENVYEWLYYIPFYDASFIVLGTKENAFEHVGF